MSFHNETLNKEISNLLNNRLVSLDLFRGIVMFLLLAEHVGFYHLLTFVAPENYIISTLVSQFFHHEWNGMHFWDLIQPYFTFIIGVAMTLSLRKRWHRGEKWMQSFRHIIVRCSMLFILGIILRCCVRGKLVWELWNILTLLSFNIFITFLIFRFRDLIKLIFSFGLLFITEILYRFFTVDGFDQPFVKDHNFGAFVDLILMGKTHPDGWVVFNAVPTTAHAIWGVLTGNLLLKHRDNKEKFKILVLLGLICIAIGHAMDLLNISPINKHLATSTFMIVSGGWCLITFAFLYWLTDIKGYRKWTIFFTVVGMNPIFIYVFSRTVGRDFLNKLVPIFTRDPLSLIGFSEGVINLITYMTILSLEWYLCYWLYKRRIFIKL
jgi:predicted acyltransferase